MSHAVQNPSTEARMRRAMTAGAPAARGRLGRGLAAGLVLWALACTGDGPMGAGGEKTLPDVPGLLISEPLPAPPSNGHGEVVWVALQAGMAPVGFSATIRSSSGSTVTLPVINGGFDPAALPAGLGDTITVTVSDLPGRAAVTWQAQAKAGKPPVIVRTEPPPRKRDVPLNASMLVVFSEPVDPATITNQTVRLLKGTAQVPGQVGLDAAGIRAEFVPLSPLEPVTDYTLEVTEGVKDLSGEALAEAAQVVFTTGATPSGFLRVITATTGSAIDPDGYRVIVDGDFAGAPPVQVADTVLVPVDVGSHTVGLFGAASNCVVSPVSPVAASVSAGNTTVVGFSVNCVAPGQTGYLWITTTTTGTSLDLDGYQIIIDGDTAGRRAVQIRDTLLVPLGVGSHTVALTGATANCAVSPPTPITVIVDPNIPTSAAFSVVCSVVGPSGLWRVSTASTGASIDPDGYWVILDHDTAGAWDLQSTDSLELTLAPGSHTVSLAGVAMNCGASPPALVTFSLSAGDTVVVAFAVDCAAMGTGNLAFVRDDQIYLTNADGTGLVQLTSTRPGLASRDPAWAPDGQRLAFSSNRDGAWTIYVMNADGSNVVPRTSGGYDFEPAWSPDGQSIAFTSLKDGSAGVFVVEADGPPSSEVILNRPGYDANPAWSPDGQLITFTSDWRAYDFLYDLYVMNADGSGVRPLIEGNFFGPWTYFYEASWAPDGRRIAVAVCEASVDLCLPGSGIAVANADGTGLDVIAPAGHVGKPAWSPDGGTIAFSSWGCQGCTPSLRFVRADGSAEGSILANGSSPAWRPE